MQAFRGDARASSQLHPLEKALLLITAFHLCFLPWALGTVQLWSQCTSLALSAIGFGISLVNRHYTEGYADGNEFRLIMWPKVVRFPFFWLGLALLGYITIQGINPAWRYSTDGRFWWLVAIPHLDWLPTGMETPFSDMNAWRMLIIYGSAWLLICSLWIGVTRRKTALSLLSTVVVNGTLLALVGILERVAGNGKILWFINTRVSSFYSTIVYKNHAGAYFNLVLVLCISLVYWYFVRRERRMERANPAPVYGFVCVPLVVSVLLTYSRAAAILLLVFLAVAFVVFITRSALSRGEGRSPWITGMLCALFAAFLGASAYFLNVNESFDRLGRLLKEDKAASVNMRQVATTATWEMAQDNLVTGWGAGSFRHYFPVYQERYPEIHRAWGGRPMRWEYAHNDYVQILAEIGLIGAGLLVAMLVCWLVHVLRSRIYLRPHLCFLALGLLMLAIHCWVDFQSYNPAILLTAGVTAALTARWSEFENRRL